MIRSMRLTPADVRAHREGRTETRVVVKQSLALALMESVHRDERVDNLVVFLTCPYQVGDLVYGRETWMTDGADCLESMMASGEITPRVLYRANEADAARVGKSFKWRPSTQMPMWAARIWFEITARRLEKDGETWVWVLSHKEAERP